MKLSILACALISCATFASADDCHARFTDLLVNGNQNIGPTKIHITQEIVGAGTSITHHHSDNNGNGMSEAIDPASNPWSLFVDDKMYMSPNKGATWNFVTAFDGEKGRADNKAAMIKDAATAKDLVCAQDDFEGASHDIVEGSYISSTIEGAEIYEKLWVNQETDLIVQSFRHVKSASFETKTTQIITLNPDLVLPVPE